MSFTLHYGGVGRAFTIADTLPGEDDGPPIPYTADDLMGDIQATIANGGGWLPIITRRGDALTVWFGAGVPMYITETDDDEDLLDALADVHDAEHGGAQVLDLEPVTRSVTAPRVPPRTFSPDVRR